MVTPSYNQGQFIRETIESVLSQDYPRLEYLVMDGGSTDGTVDILQEYSRRLAWVSRPDGGQAAAVNEGWRRGTGDILAWLNSDDVYLPGAVRTAVAHLVDHPEVDVVYGEARHIDEWGRALARYPTEPFVWRRLTDSCFISQPTAFMRRSALARVGFLDEGLHYCMDYDLWIRLGRHARFACRPEYLALSRLHPATKTLGQRRDFYAEVLRMMYGHFGWVAPTWLYAYAKEVAQVETPRGGRWRGVRVFARGSRVALGGLLRYGRRAPIAEVRRWARFMGPTGRLLWRHLR